MGQEWRVCVGLGWGRLTSNPKSVTCNETAWGRPILLLDREDLQNLIFEGR